MGNCFTKTMTYEIIQMTSSETGERPPAPSISPKKVDPTPPPDPKKPSCEDVWPALQRPMLDVRSLYILERELWRGEFDLGTTTYLCTERATGLRYACKCVSKLGRAADVERLRREVAVLQRLSGQPNVAGFRAAFEDAECLYLVTELCSGGELFDRLAATGRSYSERHAAAVCRDVLAVVHACHYMEVMHRDIRPENFLFAFSAEDAPLKAVDFVHSVFIEHGKVYEEVVGSAYYVYVAPEVLRRNYGREIDVWSAGVILYILLCGWPPFWAETEKGIFDAILVSQQVDFCSNPWPTISESAKDLIRQMLNRDPQKRITAVQALEHPWLKEGGASDRPIDSVVLLRMKQFKAINKPKQLDAKPTVENLSPQEIEGLKQLFSNMDKGKRGTITLEELRIGFTSKIPEAEVQKRMEAAVDVDKSGNIDYMKFLTAMMNKLKRKNEKDFLLAFQQFDKGSG